MGILKFIQHLWASIVWYYKAKRLIAVIDFHMWADPNPNNLQGDGEFMWRGFDQLHKSVPRIKVLTGQSLWEASKLSRWTSAYLLDSPSVAAAIREGWFLTEAAILAGGKYLPKPAGIVISHRNSKYKESNPASKLTALDQTLLYSILAHDIKGLQLRSVEEIEADIEVMLAELRSQMLVESRVQESQ